MPLPRRITEFNKRYLNHLTRPFVTWLPGFGLLAHVGRTSGRRYETPVNVFHRGGRYVFALTYGEGDWVKNVFAAGGCDVRTRRVVRHLVDPQRVHDPTRCLVPAPPRWILGLIDVHDFVVMREADAAPDRGESPS